MSEAVDDGRPQPWLSALQRCSAVPSVALVGLLLAAGVVALQLEVIEPVTMASLFLLPVGVAGLRFGAWAGGGAGIVAAALTSIGAYPSVVVGIVHSVALVAVGTAIGSMSDAYAREYDRGQQLHSRQHEESSQRAALVQLVSDELRTPLTVIRGTMDTLSARPDAVAPRFRSLVEASQRSAGRLEEMVGMMLATADDANNGSDRWTDVEVESLVRHAVVSLGDDAVGRLRVDVEPAIRVETVEAYLWLALRCLLDNALRFSNTPVEVSFVLAADHAVLIVRDHGPGLPEGFEAASIDLTSRGTGLYTASRLAMRLGGELELESREGQGVTARILLPRLDLGSVGDTGPAPVVSRTG